MKTYAIIPSGGDSKRFGGEIPKQYVKINGKEIIVYTIELFQNCEMIDEIIIAAKKEYFGLLYDLKQKYNLNKISNIIEGGKERQDSVYKALSSLTADTEDLIAVHDAARPLLSNKILAKALNEAKISDSIVVAIKARDTLIKGNMFVEEYVDRNNIYYAQTPQIFKYKILSDSMNKAYNENFIGTDESMIVKKAGYTVKIIEGDLKNFKITNSSDIDLFKSILSN
ncbi:MAG: 2-C-methyl-D-erythritol 4-phosphate cytidylyltransferase [Bacteroidetes bacterium]|nr:2-C-methyl-D-erythritol 4-phosphate cytidylyltransferase [Bacteroidota bacterium]